MGTLEITLRTREASVWPVVAEYSTDDGQLPLRAAGTLTLDHVKLLEVAMDLAAYGQILGEALFHDDVRRLFDTALDRAGEGRLRLLLFVEDEGLRAVRWERLCAFVEGGWQPLATYQRVPFSRYLPSQTDRRFPPIGRGDLHALVVAASPASSQVEWGLPLFDVAAAVAGVTAAYEAAGVPYTLLSTGPGAAGPPSLDAICAAITRARTTALHIVAHGRNLEDGPVIYLSHGDSPDAVDGVTATRLIERLNDLQSPYGLPHLVFLCACETAQENHNGALGGLGQRLVQQLGTPAVVAMADRVSVATATALSSAFYSSLLEADGEAEGEVDVALVRATAGLAEREDVTVPVLYQRLGARPLFTRAAQRAPDPAEVAAGLDRLAAEVRRRAPVLLPELDGAAAVVRAQLATPEAELTPAARAELDEARTTIATICAEAVELTFDALATGAAPPPYKGDTCPFPGLAAFAEPQQKFFFGRDELVRTMAAQLERGPFLAVAGPSGCGKSSAVLAGLVPMLRERRPGLGVAYLTPGEMPLAALDLALLAAQQGGTDELVVVIDQFEELFLLNDDEDADANERLPFIAELRTLIARQTVIILLQTDYLEQCARYPVLSELMADTTLQVQSLGADELRKVAERQAAAVGLRFEAGLTNIILDDVSRERGVMPLAQHALRELWQRRRGRWLRTTEYLDLGGIKEAIARTADQIVSRQDRASRQRVRDIFLRLTRLDRDVHEGDEPNDTRQRVKVADLVPAGEDPERTEALLRELAEARLVVRNADVVEVAHEALIRSWRLLRQWIADDRSILLQLEDLRHDAQKWDQGSRSVDFLWAGKELAAAEALAALPRLQLNALERAFLDACIAEREREREAQAALLAEQTRLREAAEASTRLAQEEAANALRAAKEADYARALAEQYARQAIEERTRADLSRERAEEEARRAEQERLRASEKEAEARAETQRALAAETEVLAKARKLRRRFWIMTALTSVALLLFGVVLFQLVDIGDRIRVSEVNTALALGETDRVLTLAAEAPRDLRLNAALTEAAKDGARRVHRSFTDTVNSAAFSPDGATYLAGSSDGSVRIWDRATGELVRSYTPQPAGAPAAVYEAIYTPAGPIIGTSEGDLILIGAADVRPFAQFAAGEITSLSLSADGAQLLSSDGAGEVSLWDIARGERLRTVLRTGGDWVEDAGYFDGGRAAFAVTESGVVYLYDTATWAERGTFELRRPDAPDADGDLEPDVCVPAAMDVLPLPSGDHLLAGCTRGSLEEWTTAGEFVGEFSGHNAPVLEVAVLVGPAGPWGVVSSSFDQTLRLWEYPSRRQARLFQGHESEVYGLAVSPDGSEILSGSFDRTARLWDARDGLREADYTLAAGEPLGLVRALAVAGGQVVAADDRGMLASWSWAGGAPVEASKAPGSAVALSADGRTALVKLPDDQLAFWDVVAHREISTFPGELQIRPVTALSPDGALGLVALVDGAVELRAADGGLVHRFEFDDGRYPNALAFSPDAGRALFGFTDGSIGLWSMADGARIGDDLLGHSDEVVGLAFSADGRRAISGGWDQQAVVWDLERGAELARMRGHTQNIVSVAFSPDGTLALTGSTDRTVRLWQVSDGLELGRYGEVSNVVSVVAFDPADGTALIASESGEVQRWRPLVGEQLWEWLRANRALP